MNAGKGSLTINLGANCLKITRLSLNVSLLHKHQCHTLLIAMFYQKQKPCINQGCASCYYTAFTYVRTRHHVTHTHMARIVHGVLA